MAAPVTETLSKRRPRYLNPFEGRKKLIYLSGLFLFDLAGCNKEIMSNEGAPFHQKIIISALSLRARFAGS